LKFLIVAQQQFQAVWLLFSLVHLTNLSLHLLIEKMHEGFFGSSSFFLPYVVRVATFFRKSGNTDLKNAEGNIRHKVSQRKVGEKLSVCSRQLLLWLFCLISVFTTKVQMLQIRKSTCCTC